VLHVADRARAGRELRDAAAGVDLTGLETRFEEAIKPL